MTIEDRIPQELARLIGDMMLMYPMNEREQVAFRRGITLTTEYFAGELESLTTAMRNAKPRLTEGKRTVRR